MVQTEIISKIENKKNKSKVKDTLGKVNKVFYALLALCAVFSILSTNFLTFKNWMNIILQSSTIGIVCIGMTFVIITGGIDLSVGSVAALCGVLVAGFIQKGISIPIAIIMILIVGIVIGLFNGVLITRFKMAQFIVTLAVMAAARGASLVYTEGKTIPIFDNTFSKIGDGYIGPIPIPVIITIVLFAIGGYIISQTVFGRYIYAIGSNKKATRLSGINVKNVELFAYAIVGLLSAVSGVVLTARLSAAMPTAATGLELDAIAAVVIGGTSLSGGKGTMFGTFVGVILISVLNNGLNLLNVSPFYQSLVKGFVILIAVFIDSWNKRSIEE